MALKEPRTLLQKEKKKRKGVRFSFWEGQYELNKSVVMNTSHLF
jgi:hypothetical protein